MLIKNATFSVGINWGWATGERCRSSCPLFMDIRLSLGGKAQAGYANLWGGSGEELAQNHLGTKSGVGKGFSPAQWMPSQVL